MRIKWLDKKGKTNAAATGVKTLNLYLSPLERRIAIPGWERMVLLAMILSGVASLAPVDRHTVMAQSVEKEHDAHVTAHWAYHGVEGASHWGLLSPEYARCEKGRRQSPIDIHTTAAHHVSREFRLDYRVSRARMVNRGHTVQVNVDSGSFLRFDGRLYALRQFHFHEPSEHQLNGQSSAMEMHLVHQDQIGHVLVLAILMKLGERNAFLETFWSQMPAKHDGMKTINDLMDVREVLPDDMRHFAYDGSLTTPPCHEGVRWLVLHRPIQISSRQLEKFLEVCGDNARPVQPLHGRDLETY